MRTLSAGILLSSIVVILGCGGSNYTYAPVAGKVTLNGKAIAGASVEFQPIASSKDKDPGSGSMGITDADGKFRLKSQLESGVEGAIVGKHRVRIFVYTPNTPGEEDRDADSSGPKRKPGAIQIPTRYNSDTTLSVDVPAGGLQDHHFDLKSP